MKWRKRQKEIARLKARHAGSTFGAPFPNLKLGLDDRKVAPCSDRLAPTPGAKQIPPPTGLIVDHFHKSSLQVILPSELPWAGGKKP